ncbi:MAG: protein kinase [Chthoniobacterales bacterium]
MTMEFVEGVTLADLLYGKTSDEAAAAKSGNITNLIRNLRTARSKSFEVSALTQTTEAPESVPRAKESRIIPIQQALNILGKICDAVQFAHEHGVLHRDLKPGNILLREDGEPLVADFGLAKMDGGEATFSLSLSGHVVGTLENMAPEQAISSKDVDERADVYAIGTILYQMITGRRYFEATGNIVADAQALQSHTTVRPRVYNRQIDSDLEVITLKALRSERSERYRNVSALKADIDHYLHGELISAKPVTVWALTQKTILRNKALSAVIATSILLLIVTAFAFVLKIAHQRDMLEISYKNATDNQNKASAAMRQALLNEQEAHKQAQIAKKNEDYARQKELEAKEKQKQLEQEQFAKKFAEGRVKEVTAQSSKLKEEKLQKEQELQAIAEQNERLRNAQEMRMRVESALAHKQDKGPEVTQLWNQARTLYAEGFLNKNLSQKKPEAVLEQINQCMELVSKILLLDSGFAPAWVLKGRLYLACMEIDSAADTFEKAKRFIPENAVMPASENLDLLLEATQKLKNPTNDPFRTGMQILSDNTGAFNYTNTQILRYFADHPNFHNSQPGNLLNRSITPSEAIASLMLNATGQAPQITIEPDPAKPDFFRLTINHAEDVTSLSPLQKLKISQFSMHGCRHVDWVTIEQMSLDILDLSGSAVNQIAITAFGTGYARIRELDLSDSGISQIAALAQMPMLEKLNLTRTPVSDLTPLRGKRLKEVNLCGTGVMDIAPITQNALRFLDITDAPIKSLTPLRMISLETLVLGLHQIQDSNLLFVLRGNRTLNIIRTPDDPSDQSATEFWRRYDASEYPAGSN